MRTNGEVHPATNSSVIAFSPAASGNLGTPRHPGLQCVLLALGADRGEVAQGDAAASRISTESVTIDWAREFGGSLRKLQHRILAAARRRSDESEQLMAAEEALRI